MENAIGYPGAGLATPVAGLETSRSAVSWAAIIAGGVTAVAATLILLALGGGIGLTTVSPWWHAGVSGTSFAVGTAIWLIVVQWISSAFGGYVAGRLRTKWTGLHTDEVFFRDTAHGFLAWAAATVIGGAFLASAVVAAASGGAHAVAMLSAPSAAPSQHASGGVAPMDYYADMLFRSTTPAPGAPATDDRPEITRILTIDLASGDGDLPPADRAYLAQRAATQAGLSRTDAEARVDSVTAQIRAAEMKARQAADTARKATAALSITTALAMLVGAFIAAVAGALGGRLRDEY